MSPHLVAESLDGLELILNHSLCRFSELRRLALQTLSLRIEMSPAHMEARVECGLRRLVAIALRYAKRVVHANDEFQLYGFRRWNDDAPHQRRAWRSALKDYRRHLRPRRVAMIVALRRASRPAISPTQESPGLASNHPPAPSCPATCGTRACTHRTRQSGGRHGTGPLSYRSNPWTDCRPRTRAARAVVPREIDPASHRRGRSSERPTSARVDAATHTARVARCASPRSARRSRGTPRATAPDTRRESSPNAHRVPGCSGRARPRRRTDQRGPATPAHHLFARPAAPTER